MLVPTVKGDGPSNVPIMFVIDNESELLVLSPKRLERPHVVLMKKVSFFQQTPSFLAIFVNTYQNDNTFEFVSKTCLTNSNVVLSF